MQTRMVSLLDRPAGRARLDLPARPGDPRPFRGGGHPAGARALWSRSPRRCWVPRAAGRAPWRRAHRTCAPRALVTNLGVHFKLGRENALAWVTLHARPGAARGGRAGARVRLQRQGTGHRHHRCPGPGAGSGLSPAAPYCGNSGDAWPLLRQCARGTGRGRDWPLPGATGSAASSPGASTCPRASAPDAVRTRVRPHAVARRRNVRVHEAPAPQAQALACRSVGRPRWSSPVGSGQQFTQPLAWRKTPPGPERTQRICATSPGSANVEVELLGEGGYFTGGAFGQFEEFRLPVRRAWAAERRPLVNVRVPQRGPDVGQLRGGWISANLLPVASSHGARQVPAVPLDFRRRQLPAARGAMPPPGQRERGGPRPRAAHSDAADCRQAASLTLDHHRHGPVSPSTSCRSRQGQELVL